MLDTLQAIVFFPPRAGAQSDGKIMQISKVNEEGLGRGGKNATLSSSFPLRPRFLRLDRSLDPSRALQNLEERKETARGLIGGQNTSPPWFLHCHESYEYPPRSERIPK